jgi:murein DD-endopeptidase MepM/ murein hydrolase activator NlpD
VKTPYDGKIALWHWKGTSVPETSIEQLVANIKSRTPNVKQIWVKVSDGVHWMGEFDDSALAINGPQSIDRWVKVLEANGMEFHAWCVPQGLDIPKETAIINAVCKRPGVRSMVLDIEPYVGFWEGGREAVRPFMMAIRRALGSRFHIGMSIDPRPWHYKSVFPSEWFPFVDSIHPQTYWHTFRRDVDEVVAEVYDTWKSFGKPIIPVLQGDALLQDQQEAHTLTTQQYGAKGLSWWRYGVISQWGAVNTPIKLTSSPADPVDTPIDNFTDEVIVKPNGSGFRSGTYADKYKFSSRQNTWGWNYLYISTSRTTSKVWAEWKTTLPKSGRYEISAFIPNRRATTTRARYKVHGIVGTSTEVVIDINQNRNRNAWVPLGVFDLDKTQPNAGRVFLNDVTGEKDAWIAFDAVRFRRIVTSDPGNSTSGYLADGYDAPMGTSAQRSGTRVWPSGWLDASPFGVLYFVGTPSQAYHTGADLNYGTPYEDKGMAVYACASGVVTFASKLSVWGNVIVIRHDPLKTAGGAILYSRYGHVQNMRVNVGDRVKRGQQICEIGDAFGRFVPHLHFDLSPTTRLETHPSDWPGTDYARLIENYIDPLQWIRRNRP